MGPGKPATESRSQNGRRPKKSITPAMVAAPVHQAQDIAGMPEHNATEANTMILELLTSAPSALSSDKKIFLTAYAQTLMTKDPRNRLCPQVRDATGLSKECLDSWQSSMPSKTTRNNISRIIWDVNTAIAERFPNLRFVVEPFGSVSWRGQTGSQGDLDLVLRDYDRPLGYTGQYWGEGGGSNRKLPAVYNMQVVANTLRDNGFLNVVPIKWASTPIVKFKDPYSDFAIDLNVNDTTGLFNSALIQAYCRLSPYQLRPLIHVVKLWTKSRNLNDPSGQDGDASLSSYCWVLLVLAYMQAQHGLPNLQEPRLVKRVDREDIRVWVGWGRREGIPADIAFADDIERKDYERLVSQTVEWRGQKFLHGKMSVGDLVKGFFTFFNNFLNHTPSRRSTTEVHHTTHCFSVWKGGIIERGSPLQKDPYRSGSDTDNGNSANDDVVVSEPPAERNFPRDPAILAHAQVFGQNPADGLEKLEASSDLPAAASQGDRVNPFDNRARTRAVAGYKQLQDWITADLVVQDPFLHDKNCARGLNHETFIRLQEEVERANDILSKDGALEDLLAVAPPLPTKAEKRAAKLAESERVEKIEAERRKAAKEIKKAAKAEAYEQRKLAKQAESLAEPQETSQTTSRDEGQQKKEGEEKQTDGSDTASAAVIAGLSLLTLSGEEIESASGLSIERAENKVQVEHDIIRPSLGFVDTIYSADSVEFAPFRSDIFVCGTYQLEKIEPVESEKVVEEEEGNSPSIKRLGRALIYQASDGGKSFQEIQRFDGPAVLDMKWSPVGAPGGNRLAISNAEGEVTLHKWDEHQMSLSLEQKVQVEESKILCLSLDWSNQLSPADSTSLMISLSNGKLAHLTTDDTGEFVVEQMFHAHDYEPWITAFDLWQPQTVWSGGDDLKLKKWDLRSPIMPTLVNKQFEGGVTTIAPNPHVEHLLAIGSYDENLRIFDTRNARTPIQTIPTGGGIWRTKWHPSPSRQGDVLLACMHGGFKVIKLDQVESWLKPGADTAAQTWSESATFNEHTSIAYGVDWQRVPEENTEDSLVASCSFYDHLLHVWRA